MLKLILRPPAGMAATLACAAMLWAPAPRAAENATAVTPVVAPFNTYRAWRDEPLADWRAANRRVDEIGGWRTYLRESQPAGDDAGQDAHSHHGHHNH